ncbi:hypothetical protein PMAYCL1PPCAC_23757, partial [Pristionchus mayeri]
FSRMSTLERALLSCSRNVKMLLTRDLPSSEKTLVSQRIQSLFDYNVGDGKNKRGHLLLSSFDAVNGKREWKETASRSAAAIEVLQSYLLIADDMMDESETRRGKDCWYRREGIGLSAINDVLLLQSGVESEMREAFRGHPNERLALTAFEATVRKTIVGQLMDTSSTSIEHFNWQRYSQLVEHKTSHYTFVLPLTLGLLAAEVEIPMEKVTRLALSIGYLFQSQDDWLDVYGKTALTGKLGSDIKDQKCTWLSCKAVEKSGSIKGSFHRLKSAFDNGDEDEVRRIYEEIKLSEEFKRFEDEYSDILINEMESVPHLGLTSLLKGLVTETRRRQK